MSLGQKIKKKNEPPIEFSGYEFHHYSKFRRIFEVEKDREKLKFLEEPVHMHR